ncbi:MAG: class III signal peptide-containing protein [Candidatus Micrarchaeia archaeon]|jgi:uncharacterized protein (UPF0333 family)
MEFIRGQGALEYLLLLGSSVLVVVIVLMVIQGTADDANNSISDHAHGYAKVLNKIGAVSGACGASAGRAFYSAPTIDLCATGTASSVSGSGPWNWICYGLNGGTDESCSARKA